MGMPRSLAGLVLLFLVLGFTRYQICGVFPHGPGGMDG